MERSLDVLSEVLFPLSIAADIKSGVAVSRDCCVQRGSGGNFPAIIRSSHQQVLVNVESPGIYIDLWMGESVGGVDMDRTTGEGMRYKGRDLDVRVVGLEILRVRIRRCSIQSKKMNFNRD